MSSIPASSWGPRRKRAGSQGSLGVMRAGCQLALLAVLGCGGPQEPAASADTKEPATSGVAPPLVDEATDSGAVAAGEAEATDPELEDPAAEDPNAVRDVVYKMTKGGLEIEVDGVKFAPHAKPAKLKGGAWGVTITVEAEGVGDDTRHLLNPEGGVLAFAGSVKRKAKTDKFGDERKGEESVELMPGATSSFESRWPKSGKSAHGLWWGEELNLEVGLWGLGGSKDTLRPVKQFFTLRMVAGNKPQPIIQPPKSAE